jgi:hypothetical protein
MTISAQNLGLITACVIVVAFVIAFVFIIGLLWLIGYGAWRFVHPIRLAPTEDDVDYLPPAHPRPYEMAATKGDELPPVCVAEAARG